MARSISLVLSSKRVLVARYTRLNLTLVSAVLRAISLSLAGSSLIGSIAITLRLELKIC